jgi:outer membrane protein
MKQIVAIFLLALILIYASSALAADEIKFASVDVQKILVLSDAGKEAKGKLDMHVLKVELERNSKEKELNKLNMELEKQSAHLSETERITKEKVYANRLQEFQQFITKSNEDIRAENAELSKSIVGNIIKVIQDYGRNKGFHCIFIKNESMLYLDDNVDITDAILHTLNAM